MNQQINNTCIVCALSLLASASGWANDDLVSVCGKSDFSVKKQVTVQQSKRVSVLQGGMLRIEGEGTLATEELIKSELNNIGINKDCAEYFVSQGDQTDMSGRIYFKFDSARLTPASITVLDAMLETIRDTENNILLEGHTDSYGSDAYNFTLGMKRALTVQGFLVDNQVDSSKIEAVSYGEKQPIASNANSAGRQQNRRVEIKGM
ncbi:OmpA family protein [Vibrio panuliri]|uniref:OmpA-like domain-containing protein n=1 Tax=Vibrio panuliri TaxID=1381081 RepID=A0A1Q9HB50_9VIBR|nr:OmpA family protein [Vibrio panuliri]KAB1457541.1 OmpA family protein [Vibrio panuliri]OLQ86333.1 hypothetical protein BIY22_11845 [Vibrio panuliri]OLQ87681.1 hypothetical protein BIY20_13295 [Vibrio panuliri]